MKKFIIGLVLGFTIGATITVYAQSQSKEFIINDAWDSTSQTLRFIGQ